MQSDLLIYLLFWFVPPVVFFILAYLSSKSGSWVAQPRFYRGSIKWVSSDEDTKMKDSGYFKFALTWLVLGLVMFFIVGSDRFDLWFPKLYK